MLLSLKAVLIPASVKYIGDDAFSYCSDLTVYCYENSYAHKYCIQYKVACKTFQLGEELQYTPTKKGVTE